MTKNRPHRNSYLLVSIDGLPEDRSFSNSQPHIEAEKYEHSARQKRKTPPEGKELPVGEPSGKEQEDAAREEESDGGSELREHAVPGALVRRGVLDGKEHSAAPLAPETQSLAEAAQCEQERRSEANRTVGWQSANRDRGYSHSRQCDDQGGLASDAVAEVTEEGGTDRSRQE